MTPQRIQRKRTAGWRMPEGAIYVGRPTVYGNPIPVDGDWITWMAVAIGHKGDPAGRRQAAVDLHRAWITRSPIDLDPASPTSAQVRMSDGTTRTVTGMVQMQALGFAHLVGTTPTMPERPDLAPLAGRDLVCWCPLEDAAGNRAPCHADVLLELANPDVA